jgi:hypothetical protein
MISADKNMTSTLSRLHRPKWAKWLQAAVMCVGLVSAARADDKLDEQLAAMLANAGFTGRIETTLEQRLGRPIDRNVAELILGAKIGFGRSSFFGVI